MNVLLQFFIENKQKKHERFLFWSCVLDSSLNLSDFDLSYLNSCLNIENFTNFVLRIENKLFAQEILISEYKEYIGDRPEVFLVANATMESGSPYRNASSMMKTYYQIPADFISNLAQFTKIQKVSEFTKFQLQIISTIKKELGIDIIKNESIPGCLSVYTRLPVFLIDGNFNALNGRTRYITIVSQDDNKCKNAIVEIEIKDEDKVLLSEIGKYTTDFYYEFPSKDKLEHFTEIHVSIYSSMKTDKLLTKIYEEHFYFIRSYIILESIGGGHSKITKNRFLNKSMDEISIMYHQTLSSTLDEKEWIDWERYYKSTLFGNKLKELESLFFDRLTGREKFLNWARKILSRGQRITIVDPFFDSNGLHDFCACIDTDVKIRIVMKNPQDYSQYFKIDTDTHLKEIFVSLPRTEVYFADNIHDRYLLIEEDKENVLYSLSNSWNGTVNNYSLYIQEVPFLLATEIVEEIETHIKIGKPQVNIYTDNKERIIQKKDESIYTQSYINNIFEQLKTFTSFTDTDYFIQICCELFWANYFGKTDKVKLTSLVTDKLKLLKKTNLSTMITKVIITLLEKQKIEFVRKSHYLKNKPFSYYDTPEKCIERIRPKNFFGTRYHHLDLDYSIYELLKSIFFLFPKEVIAELSYRENEICKIYIGNNDERKPVSYYISELLICSFLMYKYPAILPIKKDIIDFFKKVKSFTYCRMFFSMALIYHDREQELTFNELISLLKTFYITRQELLLLVANIYHKTASKTINSKNLIINEKFLHDLVYFILSNYSGRDIIKFFYKAYIEQYELKIDELNYFINQLEKLKRNKDKMEVIKLLLLCSTQTNHILQRKMKKILKPKDYTLEEIAILMKKNIDFMDTVKYHNIMPYLGYLFASNLKKKSPKNIIKNLHHSLNVDKALVFRLFKFPKSAGLFYYDVTFLLSTVLMLGRSSITNKKYILELLDWYLPFCLNAYPGDPYILSIQVIDLYTTLQIDNKNRKMYNQIDSLRDRALIASNIKRQTKEYIYLYRKLFNTFAIDNDKKNNITLLNITINLCFRCADIKINNNKKQELLAILEQIKIITQKTISDSARKLINAGLDYANSPSEETKENFLKELETVYAPYSTIHLLKHFKHNHTDNEALPDT